MRCHSKLVGIAMALALVPSTWAQDEAALAEQVKALRDTVAQQGKQIDALTKQVARVVQLLESKPGSTSASPPATAATTPAAASAQASPPAEFATPPSGETPKAEAADGLQRHVIVKGETLTSVAKHYNVSLSELLKANKDVNDRKLQIGQVIRIPAVKTDSPNPQTTPEPKENP